MMVIGDHSGSSHRMEISSLIYVNYLLLCIIIMCESFIGHPKVSGKPVIPSHFLVIISLPFQDYTELGSSWSSNLSTSFFDR